MEKSHSQILIASQDEQQAASLVCRLASALEAELTIVDTLESACTHLATGAFDAAVCGMTQNSAAELLRWARAYVSTPVVLVAPRPTLESVLSAMRAGAADVVPDGDDDGLFRAVRAAAESRQSREIDARRAERLRRLSSRLIRERRELRQRVDLICRDFVGAYRRVAEKVVSLGIDECRTARGE